MSIGLDLYRLYAERDDKSSWHANPIAFVETAMVRDAGDWRYLVSLPEPPNDIATLLGMPIIVDHSLPIGRLELRDRDGRVLGAIDNIGTLHGDDTTT